VEPGRDERLDGNRERVAVRDEASRVLGDLTR
jgi:hypothetical protein